jgi:very-short-patch-repair endonuclease
MIKITQHKNRPTKDATALKNALENRDIIVHEELNDGFKTIDLTIPNAKIDIEVDGIHHLTDPKQILADLKRSHFSHKDGYDTIHIPNEMIRKHLDKIADALAEASKIKEKIHIHIN